MPGTPGGFRRAEPGGVPPGAFHLILGRGALAGEALWRHPDVNGITFTGSYAVGMDILKNFVQDVPKPVIAEMGGKNPAIVTKHADLDVATDGVLRSAFGFGVRESKNTLFG